MTETSAEETSVSSRTTSSIPDIDTSVSDHAEPETDSPIGKTEESTENAASTVTTDALFSGFNLDENEWD